MQRTQPQRRSIKEYVLAAVVVVMVAWVTMTVAGWLTGGMASFIAG